MQTVRSQRDCWPTDCCESDAAQPSSAVWKEMAGLTEAYIYIFFFIFFFLFVFLDYLRRGHVF